jgi:hypothetical protein
MGISLTDLNMQVKAVERGMWPMPKASSAGPDFAKMDRSATGISLQTAVAMFPTPTVNDSKNNGAPSQIVRNTPNLNAAIGGSLNPQFVEWLMCWPLNWTSMERMPPDTWAAWQRAFLPESID